MTESKRLMTIVDERKLRLKLDKAIEKDKTLVDKLNKIIDKYDSNRSNNVSFKKKCETNANSLLMKVYETPELKDIHSARARAKSIESLVGKIIEKKADLPKTEGNLVEIEKYRFLDEKNYEKIITDLSGIRILVRYPQQCRIVHSWVTNLFKNDPNAYIKDWINDYPTVNEEFIVERPKLYIRKGQSAEDYMIPDYENIFKVTESEKGYSSIHYIVWYDKKYIEIQVRTIYDEAWGECTHDLVYKCDDETKRSLLERLSKCLAVQTVSAESLSKYMYEIANEEELNKEREEFLELNDDKNIDRKETIRKLEQQAKKKNNFSSFNGNVDDL